MIKIKFRGKKEEKARKNNFSANSSQEEFSDDDDDVNDTYTLNKKQKETELLPIRERTVCRSNALSSATNGKKTTQKEDDQNGQL